METASVTHRISVCSRCTVAGQRPGLRLQESLRQLAATVHLPGFVAIHDVSCMAGCGRPLTVGFSAPGKASYLFGDVDAEGDVAHLLDFARLYISIADGWCSERRRPAGLTGKIIARIPGPSGVAS